jgi:hypothetical protein
MASPTAKESCPPASRYYASGRDGRQMRTPMTTAATVPSSIAQ